MRINWLLVIMLVFVACQHKIETLIFKADGFVLIDSVIKPTTFLSFNDSISDYPIYYIGPKTDTIKIGKRYWLGRTTWTDNYDEPWAWRITAKNLKIKVDTTVATNAPLEYFSDNKRIVRDSTKNYHAFMVSLENLSDSVLYLGRTFSLFSVYREARNKKGEWVKIDRMLAEENLCGTGQPTITLRPKEIIISKLRRYKGDFLTDFRLVYRKGKQVVYSNVFRDFIDERLLHAA